MQRCSIAVHVHNCMLAYEGLFLPQYVFSFLVIHLFHLLCSIFYLTIFLLKNSQYLLEYIKLKKKMNNCFNRIFHKAVTFLLDVYQHTPIA